MKVSGYGLWCIFYYMISGFKMNVIIIIVLSNINNKWL